MSGTKTIRVPAAQGAHILLVDDDVLTLRALARALREDGYALHLASDHAEALAALEAYPIALMIADLHMPAMSGTELFARILATHPSIVRILLTGDESGAAAREAINRAEVHRFLVKPWRPQEIREIVAEALARYAPIGSGLHSKGSDRAVGCYELDEQRAAQLMDRLRSTLG